MSLGDQELNREGMPFVSLGRESEVRITLFPNQSRSDDGGWA